VRSFRGVRTFAGKAVKGRGEEALILSTRGLAALIGFLALGCSAVYSLSFYATPPEGSIVTVGVFPGVTGAAACDYFKNFSSPQDFWYLRLELTSAAVNGYDVVLANTLPPASPTAQAWVIHVVDQEKEKTFRAHAGRADVAQLAGDVSAWPGGGDLTAHLEATFSASPWKQAFCQGGQAPDAAPTTTCTCTGPNGETSTCVPANGEDDCCGRIDGGVDLPFALDVQALQCPWMCATTSPDLSRYCLEIQE
jgi:hypothetical protein